MKELKTLNSLCDIKSMINMINTLNGKMEDCIDNYSRCMALFDFMNDLNGK